MPTWTTTINRQEKMRRQREKDRRRNYRQSRRREWTERPVRTAFSRLLGR